MNGSNSWSQDVGNFENVTASDIVRYANDFANTLLKGCKEIEYYHIYGVVLSGCAQKQLIVSEVPCGNLVFYYLNPTDFDYNNLEPLKTKHNEILKGIKVYIKGAYIDVGTEIVSHSESVLKIKWKGFEFHITVTWTFSERQYCKFHRTKNTPVCLFSPETLKDIANDLAKEVPRYRRYIKNVGRQWKRFLEKNMDASLSLLRVYYINERLVGTDTRLAVLYLKKWQRVAMEGEENLSNNSLEIICTYLSHKSGARSHREIVIQFFTLMKQIKETNEPVIIQFPYLVHNELQHLTKPKCRAGDVIILDYLYMR
ncbi:hypothetical protein RFI_38584 [Reticulomyxa filosa]|uniref:Uncharacterized protein n=1 Tax=Reticulomyxa filosa TaxID=46433 RepID=X6LDW8_RETFI|nr:hypothetical protein RFI_38584 [Reticulomyxa filosa]|eukprot:ETN98904.1 hypothetical protein RFI_38584 [Reticulomyxa filosa]